MCPNNISFLKYCHKRLCNSLITGVPKIASTTNSPRRAFKLIVFFLSIAGFLWQTYTFLEIYLHYPVVQHLTTEDPEIIAAPAVTLCNRNRIKRQHFCRLLPRECSYYGKWTLEIYCKNSKKYCPAVIPENYELKRPKPFIRDDQSNEFLEAMGPQSQWDLLEKCTIEKSAQSITCNDSIMIQVPYKGLPYKCFTFFSLIDEPNKEPDNFSLSDYYSFRLNVHPEDDMSNIDADGVYVSVHDPRRLTNPIAELMVLQTGYSYRLYVTMEHRQNLPAPYETNCVDYIALWKENGGRGPLSKDDCMQLCMIDAMMDQNGCLSNAIVYSTNYTLCPLNKRYDTYELMAKCDSSCHEGCEVTEYSITPEIIDNLKDKLCNETDEHCQLSYLDLEIKFNRITVERLKSEPMFESEELFSHIGGYVGLWLGISFISLFDMIEILVDIITYPIIKWRNMKRVVSYTNDKHNA